MPDGIKKKIHLQATENAKSISVYGSGYSSMLSHLFDCQHQLGATALV